MLKGEGLDLDRGSTDSRVRHARRTSIRMSAGIIFLATLMSRITGFGREIAMAAVFATSFKTDAWLIASLIPNLLFSTINGAVATTLVPIVTEGEHRLSRRSVDHFLQELFTVTVLLSICLTALGEIAAPLIIRLIAPGFDAHPREWHLALVMTRWMIPTILFWGLAGISIGVLQSRERYGAAAVSPVVINVVRIAAILILGRLFGIVGVAVGFSIAVFSQLLLLLPAAAKTGYHLHFRWRFGHPLLRRTTQLALPFFLSSSVGTIGQIVDRILASFLVEGSLAALNYAFVLVQIPIGLLVSSLTTPLYTRLAQHVSERERESFTELAMRGLRLVLLIIVPMTAWFMLLRIPILRLIYEHGAFSTRSLFLTQHTLLFFAIGLPGFAVAFYMQRLYFATQDTRHPARYSVITILINIAGDLVLVHPLKAGGLALATGGAQWVNAFMLTRHAMGPDERRRVNFGRTLTQVSIAGAILAAITFGLLRYLGMAAWHNGLALVAGLVLVVALSGLAYLVFLGACRFPEVQAIHRRFGRALRS